MAVPLTIRGSPGERRLRLAVGAASTARTSSYPTATGTRSPLGRVAGASGPDSRLRANSGDGVPRGPGTMSGHVSSRSGSPVIAPSAIPGRPEDDPRGTYETP